MLTTMIAVEINEKNAESLMATLKMIKGVKSVTNLGHQPKGVFDFDNPPEWINEMRDMNAHPEKFPGFRNAKEMAAELMK